MPSANTQFYKIKSDKKRWNKGPYLVEFWKWQGVLVALINLFDNTTNDYDSSYDSFKWWGNYVNFYSFINEERYKYKGERSLLKMMKLN
jgi:hypothetical protein